jgi:hypothetical protein
MPLSLVELEFDARLTALNELVVQLVAETWDVEGITLLLDDSEDVTDQQTANAQDLSQAARASIHRSRILEAALSLRLDSL